jgi:hypothetical protein
MRMGATHFLMKRLPKVATEMALHVLAYNLTRVMNIMYSATRGRDQGIGKAAKIEKSFHITISPRSGPFAGRAF